MKKDRLSTLPLEILQAVFEYVPAKDLAFVQRLSKGFHSLLCDGNYSVAKRVVVREQARIRHDLEHLNFRNLSLAKALVRFDRLFHLYRRYCVPERVYTVLHAFGGLFWASRFPEAIFWDDVAVWEIEVAAAGLLGVQNLRDRCFGEFDFSLAYMYENYLALPDWLKRECGISAQREIGCTLPFGEKNRDVFRSCCCMVEERVTAWIDDSYFVGKEIEQQLGIQNLESSRIYRSLTYFMRDARLVNVLAESLDGRVHHLDTRASLLKAAILENIEVVPVRLAGLQS